MSRVFQRSLNGPVAHLVERRIRIAKVRGSIPLRSTTKQPKRSVVLFHVKHAPTLKLDFDQSSLDKN